MRRWPSLTTGGDVRAVVLVPWRPSDDRRRILWDWVRPFLSELGWPIIEGDDGKEPFSRAAAANAAATASGDWDVALLADADTVQDPRAAQHAARWALETGGAVRPWTHRIKLSQPGTLKLVQSGPEAVCDCDRDRRDRTNPHGGGGTLVVSRAAWDAVGGMDEDFRGYGNEDLALRAAIETLVLGEGLPAVPGTIWHLWHQPAPRVGSARAATPANQERWNLYRAARWKPEAMRELVST